MYRDKKLRLLAENILRAKRMGQEIAINIEELSRMGELWDMDEVRGNLSPKLELSGISISVTYASNTDGSRFWVNMFKDGDMEDLSRMTIRDTMNLIHIEDEILRHSEILAKRNK
jgi:hypothetical protein